MSDCSILTNFARKNAVPFVLGAAFGFLGHYAVKWLKEYRTSSTLPEAIHIINLTNEDPEVKAVTLAEFKTHVSIADLNNLRKSVSWRERTEQMWQKILDKTTYIVCVKKEQRLIGFGCFVGNGRMGTIFDIHVHPDHQRQKIGTLVMNSLINQIKAQEYTFVGLFGWEENKSVLDFYEKFGFQRNTYGMESSSQELINYVKK